MTDYLVTGTELTSVADAIRTKGGTSALLTWPTGFTDAIDAISSGSGIDGDNLGYGVSTQPLAGTARVGATEI